MSHPHLLETPLLDFSEPDIQRLIAERGWAKLRQKERIGAVYDFVRNDVLFGYNEDDALPASRVLADGYGQCNTKGTLLMALLRSLGVPCRFHGFTIDKGLQRGVVPELVYPLAPRNILHSWVEVSFEDRWINLEGFILDDGVLTALRERFPDRDSLCAYGAGTDCLQAPGVEWTGDGRARTHTFRRPGLPMTLAPMTRLTISTRSIVSSPGCAAFCIAGSCATG